MQSDKLTSLQKIGNWVATLLLGNTKEVIARIDEKVNSLVESNKEMKQSIAALSSTTNEHGQDITGLKVHTQYGVSHSPTVPNENGKKLLTDSGFYKTVWPKLEKEIFALMDSRNLRTLYDYQLGAKEVLGELKDNPAMDCLKEYAVNNPSQQLELIFEIASWIIRDKYAEYKKPNAKPATK